MKIETDTVEILSGVRHGRTLGSPVTLLVRNRDHENWRDVMSPDPQPDSARERRAPEATRGPGTPTSRAPSSTAPTTCATCSSGRAPARRRRAWPRAPWRAPCCARPASRCAATCCASARSPCPDACVAWDDLERDRAEPGALRRRRGRRRDDRRDRRAKKAGDSVGGVFEVVAHGVPPGLGSFAQWDRRLDGRIAQALMSIHAVKAVAIGEGFDGGTDARLGLPRRDPLRRRLRAAAADEPRRRPRGRRHERRGDARAGRGQAHPDPGHAPALHRPARQGAADGLRRAQRHLRRAGGGRGGGGDAGLVLADALLEKLGGDSLEEVLDHLEATRARSAGSPARADARSGPNPAIIARHAHPTHREVRRPRAARGRRPGGPDRRRLARSSTT